MGTIARALRGVVSSITIARRQATTGRAVTGETAAAAKTPARARRLTGAAFLAVTFTGWLACAPAPASSDGGAELGQGDEAPAALAGCEAASRVESSAEGAIAACPFTSIQTRVQPNDATPWNHVLTITLGSSVKVGTFYDGTGFPTTCCTNITITGPNGYVLTPPNLTVLTPPAAGTYTVLGACGSVSNVATLTVSPPPPIALLNPGAETVTSAQFGWIDNWGPAGGWAFHSQFPRNNNASLGTRFGFYSAGTQETVGQLLATRRFEANRTYTFRSWAQGGGDDTGVVPYQIGYAATDGVLASFTPLATSLFGVGAGWTQLAGVSYRTPASGGPIGKQIIVRLGDGSVGGQGDIWFDRFELFAAP